MAKRWGINRCVLFEYALAGVTEKKQEMFNIMVNADADQIDRCSRAYMQVMQDYDAIKELYDSYNGEVQTKEAKRK